MASLKYIMSKFDESIVNNQTSDIDSPIHGQFVVEVPDGVQIETPVADYSDLKTKKQAGLADLYPDYIAQLFDEFDTDTLIDAGAADHRATTGNYEVFLHPEVAGNSGQIQTVARAIGLTAIEAVMVWQLFSLTRQDNGFGGTETLYVELDPDLIDVEVSVDGGGSFDTMTYATGVVFAVPGTSFVARFTNTTGSGVYLGYYSFMSRA